MSELTVIVPTRGRPQNVAPIVEAWEKTGAFSDGASLLFVIDGDDPLRAEYVTQINRHAPGIATNFWRTEPDWLPMVEKLNRAALRAAESSSVVGFAGDDHLPRTGGWVSRYLEALSTTGIASCPDGVRPDNLPTQWAMTSGIIGTLGRMVPAPVEHLYCDNSVRDLAQGAGCYRWLPDVLIEHVHPMAGKAEMDEGYKRVNSAERYRKDRAAYALWCYRSMAADIAKVQALQEAASGQ